MATLHAVVEIEPWADGDDAPWPIENSEPYRWDTLDGSTPPATIGTVMAALVEWCRPEELDIDYRPTAAEALRWIAAADYLVVKGGIRAADGQTTVNPGCCADLEDWRAWPDTWCGHPAPQIKRDADGLSIREDGESQNAVTLAPGLLADVREDLIAFLAAVERWATQICSDATLAAAVIANIDRHTAITGPLDQP